MNSFIKAWILTFLAVTTVFALWFVLEAPPKKEYGLTREELGHHTWSFFHQLAAKYPEEPTPEQQELMQSFIRSIAEFYPCPLCRKHFSSMIQTNPPIVTSRGMLTQWFCKVHNIVNDRLGHPLVNCDNIMLRWPAKLKGNCGCEDDHNSTTTATATTETANLVDVI